MQTPRKMRAFYSKGMEFMNGVHILSNYKQNQMSVKIKSKRLTLALVTISGGLLIYMS